MKLFFALMLCLGFVQLSHAQTGRSTADFDRGWKFHLGDVKGAEKASANDKAWRSLSLPHDWSIEGTFSEKNPATAGGGALPGGIGWYRKTFTVPLASKGKRTYIDFDGVYQHSDVWVNGHHLGFRPNGYISFRYELTAHLNYGGVNVIAVKVDNSKQPNSRWYSGSGIYRNVWLVTTGQIAIDHWGTYVTTPVVNAKSAEVVVKTTVRNSLNQSNAYTIRHKILDANNKIISVGGTVPSASQMADSVAMFENKLTVAVPRLWSVETPYLYNLVTEIVIDKRVVDTYTTPLGIRSFEFDADKGFFLNGKPMKILGVCDHHDLGSLGAAINTRALERQLQILKGMGVNGIRTSHNPPAPELLDLCDKMGFIVMDEAFDMWKMEKSKYDYHLFWDEWHKRDLQDQILRDRNHPSVFIWSIGNEIGEQYSKTDTSGRNIARELAGIVRSMDTTRPITTANNETGAHNNLIASGALDLIGYNYHHQEYNDFQTVPRQKIYRDRNYFGAANKGVL